MLTTVTLVGLVVLVALIWLFLKTRSKDLIEEMIGKRRGSSRLVSRAEFVESMERLGVALSLTNDRIVYENPDLDAYLELRHLEEIEYDDETATGHSVEGRILRLRSHGHTFEFILDPATAREWESMLPPRRAGQETAKAV